MLQALAAILIAVLAFAAAPAGAAPPALTPSVVGEPPLAGVFRFPQAVAVSQGGGTVFVGDQYSGVVQAFSADGTYRFRAGARAARPSEQDRLGVIGGVAVDRSGHLYVLDAEHDAIKVFSAADGHFLSSFTDPSFDLLSGNVETGSGISASGLAVWQASAADPPVVFVADQGNDRVERFVLDRDTLAPVGPPAMTDDAVLDLSYPQGIALNPQGTRLYVADDDHHRVVVLDPTTLTYISEVGTFGTGAGQIQNPYDVAVDDHDPQQLYVADNLNNRVDVFDANSLAFVGTYGRSGYGPGLGNFEIVRAVGALADVPGGGVQVTDTANNRIQTFDAAGNITAAWGIAGRGPGYETRPRGVSFAPDGGVAVADTFDHRVALFGADGTFTGLRGQVSAVTGFAFAGANAGQYQLPASVSYAADGSLWIADTGNDRVVRLAPDGSVALTTPAGLLSKPLGVAADGAGGAYVADTGNGRLVHLDADGTATTARAGLASPAAVALDPSGRPFVADDTSVRNVDTNTLVAGPGGSTTWDHPAGLAFAPDGTLYVSERRPGTANGARVVRRAPDLAWDTIATEGAGDGQVIEPSGLAVSADGGTLLVADTGNNRVLRFDDPQHAPPPSATLQVAIDGAARGTVVSDLPGIACVTDCRQRFGTSRQLTLTAQPAPGSVFTTWSGACAAAGTAPTCTVTMSADQTAVAGFAAAPPPPPPPAPPAPPPPPPPPEPVRLVSARLSTHTLHRARPRDRRRHRPARRATRARATVELTRSAVLTIGVQQGRPGRLRGSVCQPVTRANRHGRPCTRFATLPLRRTVQAKLTTTRFTLTPTFAGRLLKLGAYRLTIVARDSDNNRVGPRTIAFRVVR